MVERREGGVPDALVLVEHSDVVTLGSSAHEEHLLLSREEYRERGIEVVAVGRGGDVTWHGPGQLVGYPILHLEPDRRDLHRYLRDLEEVLIQAAGSLGVASTRVEGKTGVWAAGGKIAAIGVRVSSGWITSHGFALNVAPDLARFDTIVPCGIRDERVSSLERELGRTPDAGAVEAAVVKAFRRVFEGPAPDRGVV